MVLHRILNCDRYGLLPQLYFKEWKNKKSPQWGKVWYGISFEVSAMVLLVWCVELACDRKTKEYFQEL